MRPMAAFLRILLFLFLVTQSAGQVSLRYYGVDDIEPGQYPFLKDSLGGNFALVELASDTAAWKTALAAAEQNNLSLIVWPLGHGDRYTPWAFDGTSWDISEGLEVLKYAERYVASGGKALRAVLMSHEPFYSKTARVFLNTQIQALYKLLKSHAPHVELFIYMNDMAYYDTLPFWTMLDSMMDVAGIFKHSFGTKHTLEEALKEIEDDYALIQRKGLNIPLFFALQAFETDGIQYRMPSAAEMLDYAGRVIATHKLEGVFWYPWDRVSTSYTRWLSKDRYDSAGADRWSVVRQISESFPTALRGEGNARPGGFSLFQNYPNPFNPTTAIDISLASSGVYVLEVFDVLGQKVAEIFRGRLAPGSYSFQFHARGIASGVYFYTLTGQSIRAVQRMIVLR